MCSGDRENIKKCIKKGVTVRNVSSKLSPQKVQSQGSTKAKNQGPTRHPKPKPRAHQSTKPRAHQPPTKVQSQGPTSQRANQGQKHKKAQSPIICKNHTKKIFKALLYMGPLSNVSKKRARERDRERSKAKQKQMKKAKKVKQQKALLYI